MSDKVMNVPKVRFKGFIDDWEEKRLGEVTTHRGGTSIEKYFSNEGEYKVISIGSYGLDNKYIDQNIRVISNEITDAKVVHKNELTMVLNDKTANGSIIGRCLLIEHDNEYVINQRTEIISPKESLNPQFAYTILNGNFRTKVKNIVQGGTQIYVNYPAVEKLGLMLPSLEEQNKIGTFFFQLDQLIEFQECELDKLVNLKKSMLKKMFPKNGEVVPEIRFDGFIHLWEQKTLKDIVETQIKGKAQFEKLSIGNVEYLDTARLNGGKPVLTDGNEDVIENDILILWDGSKAGTVYTGFKGALGSTLKAYRTSINSQFVYQFLKRNQQVIYKEYRTPNIPHVQKNFLDIFKISVPDLEEQKKIGTFFFQLDQLITFQQRKVNKLKHMKKTLLKLMFV